MTEPTILIVDDDDDDRFIIAEVFEKVGGAVNLKLASNGMEAISYLLETPKEELPCLVVLDYNMPGINGLDCLEAIQKTEELRYIPLYLYGNQASNKIVQHAMSLGAKALINRTRNSKLLAAILKRILPQSKKGFFQN